MNIPGFLDLKNRLNAAKWMWRWHLQNGSIHCKAHDLQDHRNEDDLKRGRMIQHRVHQARREHSLRKSVANLAKLRIDRALRKIS